MPASILFFGLAWLCAMAPALLEPWGPTSDAEQQTVLSASTIVNHSVGFSIQSSYTAAAVILEDQDGHFRTEVKFRHGDKSYREVMARLSLASSMHRAPPYEDMEQFFLDRPRVGVREGLKKIGLPASPDVGVLAGMIQSLKSRLESDYKIHVTEAVFASTHLLALYQDDLMDTAEHVGVKYITPHKMFYPILWETSAAYAGYGRGICEHWQDEEKCKEEKMAFPDIILLSVHYSRNALTAGQVPIRSALVAFETDGYHYENFTLGSDSIWDYANPDDYWAGVKFTLLAAMDDYPLHGPRTIMLTGDMAHDEVFVRFMKKTYEDYMGYLPEILSEEAVEAAAKGAAELMLRGPAPWRR